MAVVMITCPSRVVEIDSCGYVDREHACKSHQSNPPPGWRNIDIPVMCAGASDWA